MSSRSTHRCTRSTRAGRPCRAWAVPGSDPPACAVDRRSASGDGGSSSPLGPLPGNANAQTHGVYSSPHLRDEVDIDARIADLNRTIEQLSRYIDDVQIGPPDAAGRVDVDQYARLLSLHGQLTSRLGRLLRDKQQIAPEDSNLFRQVINEALDQAGEILGVKL